MKTLITGGAGFIGCHLAEELLRLGQEVVVIDSLINGRMRNLAAIRNSSKLTIVNGDIREYDITENHIKDCDTVIHLAANPDVRIGFRDTSVDFDLNIRSTKMVLDALKESSKTKKIIFASTSTVYGEAKVIPTPESYGPLLPISLYGGSKLACEAMISAYCSLFGKKGVILRLANIIGGRSNHGVIYDFVKKLLVSTSHLEVLGDGTQRKSYLHISDCVDAFLRAIEMEDESTTVLNVGSKDFIDVISIANIVIEKFGSSTDTKVAMSSSIKDGRGWMGDVKEMLLDTTKLRSTGWKPKYDTSRMAVEKATEELVLEMKAGT